MSTVLENPLRAGVRLERTAEPCIVVIFGATGDLTKRKLVPALYRLVQERLVPAEFAIVGAARTELSDEEFRANMKEAIVQFSEAKSVDEEVWESFAQGLHYLKVDIGTSADYEKLSAKLAEIDGARGTQGNRIFYLSTAPSLYAEAVRQLGQSGLAKPKDKGWVRVIIEKPFGTDLASAQALNRDIHQHLDESQIYRIDHYLGKETVQNLITLRFANVLFEPLWNARAIDHVQITVAESIGVGERGGYYDKSGALRDMVQNHLLQLLCLVAMEPPAAFDADAVRDEKLKVLRALKPIGAREVATCTVRGQYRAGAVDGKAVPGYLDELGSERSDTETFVVVKAEVQSWRWAGVPFYLRTGKRLATRASEIVVQYRSVPHSIFTEASRHLVPNRLVLRLQPDEGMKLYLMSKDPGPGGLRFKNAPLNLSYAEAFTVGYRDAYERLLMDVVRGNPTLFMRKDEVAAAWRWIDPILDGWKSEHIAPRPYLAGSWGPSDATALIARDGRAWHEDVA